jgi:LPXTG-motif cell wall-anchored protein
MKRFTLFAVAAMVTMQFAVFVSRVYAAPVTATVPTIALGLNDPIIMDDPNTELSNPASAVSTGQQVGGDVDNTDDARTFRYAWRANLDSLCQGARVTAVRVVSNTTTGPGHNAAGDGVLVAVSSSGQMIDTIQTILSGADGATALPGMIPQGIVMRGLSVVNAVTPVTAGVIDATWSGAFDRDTIVVNVIQDNNVSPPAGWMQTDIQQVEVTYDDANCNSVSGSAGSDTGVTSPAATETTAQLAKTGQAQTTTLLLSGVLIIAAGLIITRRRALK